MPVVIGAVASAAASGFAVSAAGTITFSLTFSQFLIRTAVALVLGFASSALSPKPKTGGSNFDTSAQGLTQTVRQPTTTHKLVFGETRCGGTLVNIEMTQDNKYLHLVIAFAPHEVAGFGETLIDDYSIPPDYLDADGTVNQGKYEDLIQIRHGLGKPSQTADAVMVAAMPGWTNDHRLQEVAYKYVRLEYNNDKFPGGVPNITTFLRGKKIYDPRDAVHRFTTNAALFQYDYFADEEYGPAALDDIDTDILCASANIADEIVDMTEEDFDVTAVDETTNIITLEGDVLTMMRGDRVEIASDDTLPAGLSAATDYYVIPYQFKDTPRIKLAATLLDAMEGTAVEITDQGAGNITITRTGEPRYHGSGILDTANTLKDNINDLLSATAGRAIWTGGKWLIKAGAYETPTVTLDENDIIDAIIIRTKLQSREKFNAVKGIYRSPYNLDNPSDYPVLASAAYAALDGETKYREMDFPFTPRPQTCRRVAKIELFKARQEITVRTSFNLRAIQVRCGDTIMLNLDRYGWEEKIFEVTGWTLVPKTDKAGNPLLGVQMDLRETAAEVFDWSISEESTIDYAPNTTLPNAYEIDAPTGLRFDSFPVETLEGDAIFRIVLSWDEHSNRFVTDGGLFEIQYREDGAADYKPSFFVAGNLTSSEIVQGSLNVEYDVRIRARNNLGVKSSWQSILGVVAGSSGGVSESRDYGAFVGDAVTENIDLGTFTIYKLTEDNTAAATHVLTHSVNWVASTEYTFSMYAKQGERKYMRLQVPAAAWGSTGYATFDLSDGSLFASANITSYTIEDIGNGWYRVSITGTAASTVASTVQVFLCDNSGNATYDGDNASGLYLNGAQLETAAAPTDYERTEGSAGSVNILTYSDTFDTVWHTVRSSIAGQADSAYQDSEDWGQFYS